MSGKVESAITYVRQYTRFHSPIFGPCFSRQFAVGSERSAKVEKCGYTDSDGVLNTGYISATRHIIPLPSAP